MGEHEQSEPEDRSDSEENGPAPRPEQDAADETSEVERVGPEFDGSSHLHIHRAREDASVWGYLHERYHARLLIFSDYLLGPKLRKRFTPEDLAQEAWLRVFKSFDKFEYRDAGSLYRWLCTQCRRIAAEWARRKSSDEKDATTAVDDKSTGSPGPKTLAQSGDDLSRMRRSLDKLPRLYREVLVALIIEERDPREVAEERNVTLDTLRKQKNRGLERWREDLDSDGLDPGAVLA